jgi:glycosyltransferase involved in cell wall biosynthesis
MKILYASCGGTWVHRAAAEMLRLGQEANLYTPNKNFTDLPLSNYRRSWAFSIACQPFFRLAKGRFAEKGYHAALPIWRAWLKRQNLPVADVVHSVMGFTKEPFDHAERTGALKVLDASNSHPTSFFGFWQRELDIWNPGARVGVPRSAFASMNRELERADLIVCASNYVRDSMLYNDIPESKLAVNPFGADLSVFLPRQRLPEKPRFLFAGALTLRKGLQYLIPAFERLKKEMPDAELILCGGVYTDFSKLFPKWRHVFTHINGLSHPELAKLMQSSTAFVFPSIEEGFARVISEAMAAGLPIIATHNSGATTVVENGREGIIVPTRSADAVYEAMKRMIQQPDLCDAMGKAAARKIGEQGSWACYGKKLLEIYASHVGKVGKSGAARLLK